MDDKGNIYEVDKEKNLATNIETKKITSLDRIKKLYAIHPELLQKFILMNRKERRKWLRENKYSLEKMENSSHLAIMNDNE